MGVKPGFEEITEPLDARGKHRTDERGISYEFPDNVEAFDELSRDLDGPVDSHRRG